MVTIYNVTLVNGDDFTEDSFQAAARRVSEMVRRISPYHYAELSSGESDVGRWFADARKNGVGNREWTVCSNCRNVANSKRDFAYIEEEVVK